MQRATARVLTAGVAAGIAFLPSCSGRVGAGADGGAGGPDGGDGGGPGTLAVSITAPAAGGVVAGDAVLVTASTGGDAVAVDFFLDGTLLATDDGPPWELVWDTTAHANPLPAATAAPDLGYYFVDGRYGDFRSEVNGYTNLYYAWAWRNYPTDAPWGDAFSTSLANAAGEDRRIHLNLQEMQYWTEALDRATPWWAWVRRIEMADEPGWTMAETEANVAALRAELAARGLAPPPIGITCTATQVLTEDAIFAAGLDWVGIEAYVDPPGSDVSADDVAALAAYVASAKARVPADKSLVLIMMAYDRNGGWTNLATLYDLQLASYDLFRDDPRVLAVTMFSYGRPGGTHDHPELKVAHALIAERVLGISVPWLANGPRMLGAVAHDATGGTATDEVAVTVEN